jgi:DNA invertase Pin-like site-specific DNA recombinase
MSPRPAYAGPYRLDRLRAKGQDLIAAQAARDASMSALAVEVRKAAAAGVPKEVIAREAGISKPTVYRILEAD